MKQAATFEEFQDAMAAYAKSIQGENYPGDEFYHQDCWLDNFNDEQTPEEAVHEDMHYWD